MKQSLVVGRVLILELWHFCRTGIQHVQPRRCRCVGCCRGDGTDGIMCAEVFKLGWNASSPHALVSELPLSSLRRSLETLHSFPRPVLLIWVIYLSFKNGKLVLTVPEESTVCCQPSALPVCRGAEGRGCSTKGGVPASPRPVLADVNNSLKNQGHFLPET